MKHTYYLAFLLIFLLAFTSCKKDESIIQSIQNEQQTIDKKIIPDDPPPPVTSPFYIDEVGIPMVWNPLTDPRPYKSFLFQAYWKEVKGKYNAYASATAFVQDEYPDGNCYAKAKVMLVKNGQIWNGYAVENYQFTTDGGRSATTSVGTTIWSFPPETDLTGVSIVAQGLVWGCFGFDELGRNHAIHWAEDKRAVFNLPPIEPPVQYPSIPQNLHVVGTARAELAWDASSYVDYYKISRADNGFPSLHEIGTSTTTSFVDFSVIPRVPGTIYFYVVQAVNTYGISNFSNIVTIEGHTYD